MGDEPGADPDAMWKPGYSAPADDGRTRRPGTGRRRRGSGSPTTAGPTAAAAAEATEPVPDRPAPAPAPLTRHRRRRWPDDARRTRDGPAAIAPLAGCSSPRWRSPSSPSAASSGRSATTTSADGRHRLASIPTAAVPTWIAVLDTGHITGVIGTRSTIVVLELVTNDLVGLAADSGAERWRVNAAPSHSIAQLEEVDGAAIVLVEESTGDRSIAAYDLESGERHVARGRARPVDLRRVPGEHLPAPRRCHRRRDRAARPANRRGPQRARVAVVERRLGARRHGPRRLRRGLRPADPRTRRRPDRRSATWSRHPRSTVGSWVSVATPRSGSTARRATSCRRCRSRSTGPNCSTSRTAPEPMLLVMADQEIVGYSLTGDRIAQVWRTGPVQVNEITDVGDHTYAVVQTVVAAGPNGGPVRVVDTVTGEAVAEPIGGNWVRLAHPPAAALRRPARAGDDRRSSATGRRRGRVDPGRRSATCASRRASGAAIQRTVAVLADGTGEVDATWFGRRFIERRLHAGQEVVVSGRLKRFRGALTIDNPEFQAVDAAAGVLMAGRIVPVYRLTRGADGRPPAGRGARGARPGRPRVPRVPAVGHRGDLDLPAIATALEAAHYPADFDARDAALRRLAFDELLALQLGMVGRRRARGRDTAPPIAIDGRRRRRPSGRRSPTRCRGGRAPGRPDRRPGRGRWTRSATTWPRPTPMLRLIQGDVGSGKTAVAAYALAAARARAGFQGALLAPTDLLARQHLDTVGALLADVGVDVILLAGSLKAAERTARARGASPRARRRSSSGRTRCSRTPWRSRASASSSSTSSIASASSSAAARGQGRRHRAARPADDRDADPADARPGALRRPRRVRPARRRRRAASRSAPGIRRAGRARRRRGSGSAPRRPRAIARSSSCRSSRRAARASTTPPRLVRRSAAESRGGRG